MMDDQSAHQALNELMEIWRAKKSGEIETKYWDRVAAEIHFINSVLHDLRTFRQQARPREQRRPGTPVRRQKLDGR
jgi:hypothetical protein